MHGINKYTTKQQHKRYTIQYTPSDESFSNKFEFHKKLNRFILFSPAIMQWNCSNSTSQLWNRQASLTSKVGFSGSVILQHVNPEHSQFRNCEGELKLLIPYWNPLILNCSCPQHYRVTWDSGNPHLQINQRSTTFLYVMLYCQRLGPLMHFKTKRTLWWTWNFRWSTQKHLFRPSMKISWVGGRAAVKVWLSMSIWDFNSIYPSVFHYVLNYLCEIFY